jgi:hypothetical protein
MRAAGRRFGAFVSLVLLLTSCRTAAVEISAPTTEAPTTTTIEPAGACPAQDLESEELLGCALAGVAFVEASAGTGSAVLVDGVGLVTNAHVVGTDAEVTVTFEGKYARDADVIGIDYGSDIAVLEWDLESDAYRSLPLADHEAERGATVYLAGFPGDQEGDPELTLTSGVVSRYRDRGDGFSLRMLQSDAEIRGGQSGGALLSAEGRLLGISGYSYEDFAMALTTADVMATVRSIEPPDDAPTRRERVHTVTLSAEHPETTFFTLVPGADLEFSVTSDQPVAVAVTSFETSEVSLNQTGQDFVDFVRATRDPGGEADELDFELDPDDYSFDEEYGFYDELELEVGSTPDSYVYEPWWDQRALITLRSVQPGPQQVTISSDSALTPVAHEPRRVTRGATVEGVVGPYERFDEYRIELGQGESVSIDVSSGIGDPTVAVTAAGALDQTFGILLVEDVTFFDDGGTGFGDTGASGRFTAPVAGRYSLYVASYDGLPLGYEITVR